jgi:DNA-3-methyladenine glycosylase II
VHRTPIRHLKSADAVLARVIERVGPCRFQPRRKGTHFDALLRSIVYQQLSARAAGTILDRVLALYGGRYPRPAQLLETPDDALRGAGLSRQKLAYLRDLAAKVDTGEVPLARVGRLADEEVITHLTRVNGIGRWTAQMFLMFRLGRPDVLPELDLGIQTAIQRAYDLPKRPAPAEVLRIGETWRPHATVASWYLWRSLE